MKVTVVVEYAGRVGWQLQGPWAQVIVRAMIDRGHEVRVVADCLADPGQFAAAHAEQFRSARKRLQRSPRRFQRWVLERVQPPTISLSSLVPASVWCPLDAPWRSELAELAAIRNPATLAIETAHRLWIPSLARAQARAESMWKSAVGVRARLGCLSAPQGIEPLGYCSRIRDGHPCEALRLRLRRVLGIDREAFVVAASAAHPERAGLGAFLEGWRAFVRQDRGVLVLMGRKAALLDRTIGSLGLREHVRIVGQTERPDAVLAGADAAASWSCARGSTARFVADALAMQRPVVTFCGGVGAELVEHFGAGVVMSAVHPGAWVDALRSVRSGGHLPDTPEGLMPEDLGQRLEAALSRL